MSNSACESTQALEAPRLPKFGVELALLGHVAAHEQEPRRVALLVPMEHGYVDLDDAVASVRRRQFEFLPCVAVAQRLLAGSCRSLPQQGHGRLAQHLSVGPIGMDHGATDR